MIKPRFWARSWVASLPRPRRSAPRRSHGERVPPHQKRRHFQSDEICWRTSNSIHTGADDRTALRHKPRRRKRSGGLRNPTALAEVDRGLPDGLKLGPNLRVGVQISLYLIPDLILGLAFEAGEEVVHVGVVG